MFISDNVEVCLYGICFFCESEQSRGFVVSSRGGWGGGRQMDLSDLEGASMAVVQQRQGEVVRIHNVGEQAEKSMHDDVKGAWPPQKGVRMLVWWLPAVSSLDILPRV